MVLDQRQALEQEAVPISQMEELKVRLVMTRQLNEKELMKLEMRTKALDEAIEQL